MTTTADDNSATTTDSLIRSVHSLAKSMSALVSCIETMHKTMESQQKIIDKIAGDFYSSGMTQLSSTTTHNPAAPTQSHSFTYFVPSLPNPTPNIPTSTYSNP